MQCTECRPEDVAESHQNLFPSQDNLGGRVFYRDKIIVILKLCVIFWKTFNAQNIYFIVMIACTKLL